jgi:hypothetical protein
MDFIIIKVSPGIGLTIHPGNIRKYRKKSLTMNHKGYTVIVMMVMLMLSSYVCKSKIIRDENGIQISP